MTNGKSTKCQITTKFVVMGPVVKQVILVRK